MASQFLFDWCASCTKFCWARDGEAANNRENERIKQIGRAAPSALALHRHFQSHPVGSVRAAKKPLGLSIPTLHASAKHLVRLGILHDLPTGGKAHLCAYPAYLDILNADQG
jgi:hypothetical protein